jgi:hypothetical protein
MTMDLARIVRFTNITADDFTHSYHGQPFTVKAEESILFPYDLGRLLAKHLARKILFAGIDKQRLLVDRAAFTATDEAALVARILSDEAHAPVSPQLSEAERLRKRVEDLNANAPEGVKDTGGRTKADVIAEMEKAGLPVDKRSSMATLEEQLTASKKIV